jgi:hypothetical protein
MMKATFAQTPKGEQECVNYLLGGEDDGNA